MNILFLFLVAVAFILYHFFIQSIYKDLDFEEIAVHSAIVFITVPIIYIIWYGITDFNMILENLNLALLGFSALVFTSYVLYIYFIFGVQKSISASYYVLKWKQKKYLFALIMWGFAVPIIYVGDNYLMFLAGSFICFVGGAPAFRNDKTEKTVHMVGAFGGIIFGMIYIISLGYWPVFLFATMVIALIYQLAKDYFWWIEMFAFAIIWSFNLYINYL